MKWLWLLVLCGAGCSGAPVEIPVRPVELSQFQEARGGVRVAVDPFFTVERTRGAFRGGEDFPENGLLPVHVTIENGSPGDIQVNPRDFLLIRRAGQGIPPVSAYDAFSMIKVSVGLLAAVPIVGNSTAAARNEPRLKDLESRQLQETTIAPAKWTSGFVYFLIPEGERDLAGTRVALVLKTATRRDLAYEIPVEGRRDIPEPSKPLETAAPKASTGPTGQGLIVIEGTGGGVIIRSPSQ